MIDSTLCLSWLSHRCSSMEHISSLTGSSSDICNSPSLSDTPVNLENKVKWIQKSNLIWGNVSVSAQNHHINYLEHKHSSASFEFKENEIKNCHKV